MPKTTWRDRVRWMAVGFLVGMMIVLGLLAPLFWQKNKAWLTRLWQTMRGD